MRSPSVGALTLIHGITTILFAVHFESRLDTFLFLLCKWDNAALDNESPIGRNARVQFQGETERWLKGKINGNSIEGITAPLPLRSSQVDYAGTAVGSRYRYLCVIPMYEGPSVRLARD